MPIDECIWCKSPDLICDLHYDVHPNIRGAMTGRFSVRIPNMAVNLGITMESFMEKVLKAIPTCEFGEDNDGQIVIYTGLQQEGNKLILFGEDD